MSDFGIAEILGFSPTGDEEGLGSNARHTTNRWGCDFRYIDGKIVRVYNFGKFKEAEQQMEDEPNRGRSLAGKPTFAPWRRTKPQTA